MSVTLKFGEKIITADVRKLQDMEEQDAETKICIICSGTLQKMIKI